MRQPGNELLCSASPENSCTSTLCLSVDTITGAEGEPGGGGGDEEGKRVGDKRKKNTGGESSSEQYCLSSIRRQGELGKVLHISRQLQEENA